MSTATTAPETKQRVRHPLDAVRAHIRRYVLLETAAAALLFVALWFWIGLFVDFGAFWTFAYDWVLELNFVDGGAASKAVRIAVAAIVLCGLGYVIVTRLFVRLFKEFSDPAVALVLERRFPKELGDRLITAVELADPKKAESYGFSGAMLAQTINEAADRVERLPVAQVFDWRRLRRKWFVVGLATFGLFLVAMGVNLIVQAARGGPASPTDFLWNFAHNSSIWVERNVLMGDSYWLRNSQLELVRFGDSESHPGEMRVARDDARPDLVVRTVAWVVPDAKADGGWRALKVSEAAEFVPADLFAKIDLPADWPNWLVDLNDLDAKIPAGVVPASWQFRPVGEARKNLAADPALREALDKAGASTALTSLGDWKTWTYDKFLRQVNGPVRPDLEKSHPEAVKAIDEMNGALEELAASPRMNRRLRKLETPKDVAVSFRGQTTKLSSDATYKSSQTFVVGLEGLKESVTFFARGGDAFTPPKKIALVPPPSVRSIGVDKAEPAYLYHWLAGSQAPLKGKKQIFPDYKIAVSGETSSLDVPLGSHVKLRVAVDRKLKEGVRIVQAGPVREPGIVVPDNPVTRDADGLGFSVDFPNVVKTMEFLFEFHDEDNVKGKRKVRIRPIDDQAPEILNFELGVVLRKARSKDGAPTGGALDGLLITPDAVLPVGGTVRDDVALTDVAWVFDTQPITFEPGSAGKPGRIVVQASPGLRRGSVIVSALQFTSPLEILAAPWYVNFVGRAVEGDLAEKSASTERSAPLAGFQEALAAEVVETLKDVEATSTGKPPRQKSFLKEHVLKDREFFSVKQRLPDLKMKDPKTQTQVFHSLKLWLSATDNNVETGPSTTRTRTPVTFLVVPETELLAQIGLEEEALRDRLEKVQFKLKAAQTTIDAQLPTMKAAKPDTDYALVALRVDEVRKALLDTGSSTREIDADYNRILQELQVNRVKRDKISDVQTKIVLPLDAIVNASAGNFAILEDILQRLSAGLDDDIANKRIVEKLPEHLKTTTLASEEVARLLREIEQVLNAISGGIDDTRLLEIVVNILRDQQRVNQPLVEVQNQILRRVFEDLQPK